MWFLITIAVLFGFMPVFADMEIDKGLVLRHTQKKTFQKALLP